MKPASTITALFLLLISVIHLLRLIFQVRVTVNTIELPLWMSVPACAVTASLAIWLFIENKKQEKRYE